MNHSHKQNPIESIAVVGMSARFPNAENIEAFWQNLRNGVESVSFFSDQELQAAGIDPGVSNKNNYVRAAALLENIDLFDASFFGYSPREAEIMDPQQRLLLECAWEALENAGYNSETYEGEIGVYAGASVAHYMFNIYSNPDIANSLDGLQIIIGNSDSHVATRVSYKLNLKGPSVFVQSACSTSLVAVHLACQSLLNYQCDMALAGGISITLIRKEGYLYREGGVLSPDGCCRAFDEKAKGMVNGNGVGIIVLKRLEEALADGDCIHAVVKGSAVNNDGSLKVGYTAPGVEGQTKVIAEAQALAGIDPETISYIEAHGTGTELGDPIEIAALTQVFRASTWKNGFCALGSVKTNCGHLLAAAGIASLIKTVLALKHEMIPPSLHFTRPNPRIDFKNSPFYVNTQLTEWKRGKRPRRAGISSFGIGGTNAHVIVEEAPAVETSGSSAPYRLLILSAKTGSALETMTANLAAHFKQHPGLNLEDAAYTLQVGRRSFSHRRMLVCRDINEAVKSLTALAPPRVLTAVEETGNQPVGFMFPGQGAQYVNMGLELYRVEAIFREQVDRCMEMLQPHLGQDVRRILYPGEDRVESADRKLVQTAITQPVLFVMEYALARLWMAWGVQAQAMIGHSIGEYTAACLAGIFSLEDALTLVAARGRLIQQLPGGSMLAVSLAQQEITQQLGQHLSLAAVNGPKRCVVSGPTDAVEAMQNQLRDQGIACRLLHTSHAFHSAMMDPSVEPFKKVVKTVALHPPQIPVLSNVTGTWLTPAEATDPDYWANHLRQPVRFADGMSEMLKEEERILLEVGPGTTLTTLVRQHPAKANARVMLCSLPPQQKQQSDAAFLLDTLGRLWLSGGPVDWTGFYSRERRHRIPVPIYPFERQRYWIEAHRAGMSGEETQGYAANNRSSDIGDWFYIPSWKRSIPPTASTPGDKDFRESGWLVFSDECGLGSRLVKRLKQEGHEVIVVKVGKTFNRVKPGVYTINPRQSQDYDKLFKEPGKLGKPLKKILHLWNVTSDHPGELTGENVEQSLYFGFYSLLFIAQAVGRQNIKTPLEIGVVTSNMQRVAGEEVLCPGKATVLGPCKVISQEYSNITCLSIDIQFPKGGIRVEEELIQQLIAELSIKSPDTVIAYRSFDRWVQSYEPCRLPDAIEPVPPRLRTGGVYLITGGLGGIGLELAGYLAESVQAKLVLTGRSTFPEKEEWQQWLTANDPGNETSLKIRRLQRFETLGARVLTLGADVSDRQQMQRVIHRANEQLGSICGIIHCAGIAGGGMIQGKNRETAARVLAPKVKGTIVLYQLVKDMKLDFFILCSSLSSVRGGFGQVDYCAANLFLDAFAHYHTSRYKTYTVSINWGAWAEVGMAVNAVRQIGFLPCPFWLKESQEISALSPIPHPLLDKCIRETPDEKVYVTQLRVSKHWILAEHKIMGKATLPGTAYLELARAAFEDHTRNGTAEIWDVFFLNPLMVEEDEKKEIHIILKKEGEIFEFTITSKYESTTGQDPKLQEHARGKIGVPGQPLTRQYVIEELAKRCNGVELKVTEDMPQTQENLIAFGPRWNNLKKVNMGTNEGLAILELPESFSADLETFKLHPALLDVAVGFAKQIAGGEGNYLPLSYKRFRLNQPLSKTLYSYAQYSEARSSQQVLLQFDIMIMDEHGNVLAEIEEYTLRRIDNATARFEKLGKNDPGNMMTDESLFSGAILNADGVEVFKRLLGKARLHQVIVSPMNLRTLIEEWSFKGSDILERIDSVQLPKITHQRPELETPFVAPRNEMEQMIAHIWQEMLGIKRMGIQDDFFMLGGDSLLGVQLISRLQEVFPVDLPLAILFEHPTIAQMAMAVAERLAEQVDKDMLSEL